MKSISHISIARAFYTHFGFSGGRDEVQLQPPGGAQIASIYF